MEPGRLLPGFNWPPAQPTDTSHVTPRMIDTMICRMRFPAITTFNLRFWFRAPSIQLPNALAASEVPRPFTYNLPAYPCRAESIVGGGFTVEHFKPLVLPAAQAIQQVLAVHRNVK